MATRRNVVGYRRIALGGGKYLNLAITDRPGPRGGHTIGYVRSAKGGAPAYPGYVTEPSKRRRRRRVQIKRKGA